MQEEGEGHRRRNQEGRGEERGEGRGERGEDPTYTMFMSSLPRRQGRDGGSGHQLRQASRVRALFN
jgi:hypothetical protein